MRKERQRSTKGREALGCPRGGRPRVKGQRGWGVLGWGSSRVPELRRSSAEVAGVLGRKDLGVLNPG